jgi:hypothetical protein
VGHIKDYYLAPGVPGVPPLAFEDSFASFESAAAPILRKVATNHRVPTGADYQMLMHFIALMVARVPSTRARLAAMQLQVLQLQMRQVLATPERYARFVEQMRQDGEDVSDMPDYETMQRGRVRAELTQPAHLAGLYRAHQTLQPMLARRQWSVLVAGDGGTFVTSDAPVVLDWTDRREANSAPAFGLRKTVVMFPVDSKTALQGTFEGPGGRHRVLSHQHVAMLNMIVSFSASRLVCSSAEEFSWMDRHGRIRSAADLPAELRKYPASAVDDELVAERAWSPAPAPQP